MSIRKVSDLPELEIGERTSQSELDQSLFEISHLSAIRDSSGSQTGISFVSKCMQFQSMREAMGRSFKNICVENTLSVLGNASINNLSIDNIEIPPSKLVKRIVAGENVRLSSDADGANVPSASGTVIIGVDVPTNVKIDETKHFSPDGHCISSIQLSNVVTESGVTKLALVVGYSQSSI